MTDLPARQHAEVTVTVKVGDQTQSFTADTTTTGSPYTAADKLLAALREDASKWLFQAERTHR